MRLIDADALGSDIFLAEELPTGTRVILMSDVLDAPTIYAAPAVRGKWERIEYVNGMIYANCSECGYTGARDFKNNTTVITEKYCKDCGAKMEAEVK